MPLRTVLLVVSLSLPCTLAGCSHYVEPPKGAPVSGSVLIGGKPAAGVRVVFHPQFDMGKKWGVAGMTGPDGTFKAGTGFAGTMEVPLGDYVVTFEKPRTDSDKRNMEIEVDDFQGKYSDPSASPWKVTVKKGENRLEPFQVN